MEAILNVALKPLGELREVAGIAGDHLFHPDRLHLLVGDARILDPLVDNLPVIGVRIGDRLGSLRPNAAVNHDQARVPAGIRVRLWLEGLKLEARIGKADGKQYDLAVLRLLPFSIEWRDRLGDFQSRFEVCGRWNVFATGIKAALFAFVIALSKVGQRDEPG